MPWRLTQSLVVPALLAALALPRPAAARGDLHNVNHVVVVMQENHSFDNYLGALPYVAGGPYHPGPCAPDDHACGRHATGYPTGGSPGLRTKPQKSSGSRNPK